MFGAHTLWAWIFNSFKNVAHNTHTLTHMNFKKKRKKNTYICRMIQLKDASTYSTMAQCLWYIDKHPAIEVLATYHQKEEERERERKIHVKRTSSEFKPERTKRQLHCTQSKCERRSNTSKIAWQFKRAIQCKCASIIMPINTLNLLFMWFEICICAKFALTTHWSHIAKGEMAHFIFFIFFLLSSFLLQFKTFECVTVALNGSWRIWKLAEIPWNWRLC